MRQALCFMYCVFLLNLYNGSIFSPILTDGEAEA